jgi:hypothetical protein
VAGWCSTAVLEDDHRAAGVLWSSGLGLAGLLSDWVWYMGLGSLMGLVLEPKWLKCGSIPACVVHLSPCPF